jgi:hypothetical protein
MWSHSAYVPHRTTAIDSVAATMRVSLACQSNASVSGFQIDEKAEEAQVSGKPLLIDLATRRPIGQVNENPDGV